MFLCLFIITSCEKELYDDAIKEAQRELKSEIVTGKNAENIISKLENSIKKKYKINGSGTNRITMDSIGTIKYDEIVKLTDEKGNSTYTFKVVRYDSSFSKFYNLVLQEKAEGNIVKLFEYTMTPEFAQQFSSTFNYKNFEGTLSTFTVINETPCPDNDVLVVQIGEVLEGGNSSGGNYGNTGTNTTNPTSGNESGSTGTNTSSGTTSSGSSGTSSSSGSTGTTGGGGGQFYYEDFELFIECITNGGDWYVDSNGEAGCIADPRHFRMAINPEVNPNELDEEISIPCSPTYHVITLTPYTNCEKHFLQRTTTNKNWLAAHKNTEIYQQIMDYINGNGNNCSTEREDFMNECISQMDQNPGVFNSITPFLIEKQIDDSQLDPCSKGVFQQIKNTTNCDFAQVLAKLNANGSIYNTTMLSQVAPSQKPAQTIWNSPFNYTIYISTDYSNKTKLFIATLLLHEMAHTYFLTLFDDYHNANPINPNAYNDFSYLFDLYVKKKYPLSQAADIQHQQMAVDYAIAIAEALQEYNTGNPVSASNPLQQIYSDLAYGSLQDVPSVFDALFPVGNPNRQRIINRYNCEGAGHTIGPGTVDQQNPISQPCN